MITVYWDSSGRYFRAAPNTRTVGAAVAQMARYLVTKYRISRQNLWCVGHSLGAHACGLAGKKYKFARITGEFTRFICTRRYLRTHDTKDCLTCACTCACTCAFVWVCVCVCASGVR